MLSPSSLLLSPALIPHQLHLKILLLCKPNHNNYNPRKSSRRSCPFLSHRHADRTRISCSNSPVLSTLSDDDLDVELGRLLALLPEEMRRRVSEHPELRQLIEVVMDLGRRPLARFPTGDFVLSEYPISADDIAYATSMVGDFAIDNRAGISRTLHRISAIRNRKGSIIGLTCRVGRAVSGSANLLRDLVKDGASLLLIGPPGVGKTTIIRDIARMLANDYMKRVMIVDTSNEIGGDGDIPHAGIGNARRMQVASSDMQHKVLIEAVENHMPQVIVIDEIGTKLEAMAASTIAQRGIQLVATAHGVTIENLTMNPSLEMLVGGIQSVTLGDEEASRRGVQKTILERKGPPTFTCGVEIISKNELHVHRNLEATVDAILFGRCPNYEVRRMNQGSEAKTAEGKPFFRDSLGTENENVVEYTLGKNDEASTQHEIIPEMPQSKGETSSADGARICLFVYGIPEENVMQGFKHVKMHVEVKLADDIGEADALLALQSKLKKNPGVQDAARSHSIPIYVVKTIALTQLTKAIRALIVHHADGFKDFDSEDRINPSQKVDALEEARVAIEQEVIRKGQPVELLPRPPNIISLQKDLVCKYKLQSKIIGTEADKRLLIFPFEHVVDEDGDSSEGDDADEEFDEFSSLNSERNGSPYTVNRLPLLPE